MGRVARAARGRHAGDGAQVVPAGRGRCRRPAGRHERGLGGVEAAQAGERRAQAGERDLAVGVGFLRGRTRPATALIVAFIDEHVGAVTRTPTGRAAPGVSSRSASSSPELGCKIAPATYYEHRSRTPSTRELRDAELKPKIARRPRRELRRVRRAEDLADAQPATRRGDGSDRPLHRRTAHGRARAGRRGPGQGQTHHDQRPPHSPSRTTW